MRPWHKLPLFVFTILIVLSLLPGRRATALELVMASGEPLASSQVRPPGVTAAESNTPGASPELAYTVYLPAVIQLHTGGAPVILSFTASPATVSAGQPSRLSWNVSDATSLSISPGIGAVTGDSITVEPSATTQYTLVATNASGSVSAHSTVTVVSAPPSSASFFIEPLASIDRPTSHPTVMVDASNGVHIVFTPESATAEHPTRPVLYAYCPSNCTSPEAFKIAALGDDVEYANLALTPAGAPRVMARLRPPESSGFIYQYWTCDSSCTNASQWSASAIGAAYARATGWGEPFSRFFTLDHQGRPRFVYYDAGADDTDPHWGAFYAYCDSNCGSAASWREARLLDDMYASEFALAFSPTGQPRLAYTSYDSDEIAPFVGYAECNADCASTANWYGLRLVDTVSASVTEDTTMALRTDSSGRPRLALYTGTGIGGTLDPGTLYYLSCAADTCSQVQAWRALNLGLPSMHGEGEMGVDLALDEQDRPRIAYHAPATAGFGLHYAWCNTSCETSAQGWQYEEIEPSEAVNQEQPIPEWPGCSFPTCNPPTPACTISTWDTGMRPSLALDNTGNPRLAYDADHQQAGACGTFTDTKLTRFALKPQP